VESPPVPGSPHHGRDPGAGLEAFRQPQVDGDPNAVSHRYVKGLVAGQLAAAGACEGLDKGQQDCGETDVLKTRSIFWDLHLVPPAMSVIDKMKRIVMQAA
jgi:hypothetical protein